MMTKRRVSKHILLITIIICAISSNFLVSAKSSYKTYTYDNNGEVSYTPDLYEVERVVYGSNIGVDFMLEPQDIFVAKNGDVYILDSGKNRILITDKNFKLKLEMKSFSYDGKETRLSKAKGIYVDSEYNIYICDSGNNRVLFVDKTGKVLKEISKLNSNLSEKGIDFIPQKIVVDSAKNIYIQSLGTYQGLILFDKEFNYQGFYGGEQVSTSADVITNYFWKRFMTAEQKETMSKYVPTEISQLLIDEKDFIYTITNSNYIPRTAQKFEMDSLRILNPKGKNISKFDDSTAIGKVIVKDAQYLNFVDVCKDENGFISLLDNNKGKIYHFDSQMNLIAAFGAYGDYKGAFLTPVSMVSYEEKIYVLDAKNNSITVFVLTDYGSKTHSAIQIYNEGSYGKSIDPWKDVLKLNTNCDLAYIGIGNAFLNNQDYIGAMKYFGLGHSSDSYNQAFRDYRVGFIRNNFSYFIISICIFIFGVILFKRYKKRRQKRLVNINIQDEDTGSKYIAPITLKRYQYPFYIMKHPINGFEALKTRKATSLKASFVILFLFILLEIISYQFTGKQFEMHEADRFNLVTAFLSKFSIILLWTISNWCFCVLMEGKATFSNIWTITIYSLCPYILSGYINVILSNILTREESVFCTVITIIGIIWSLIMLISAFVHFHEFEISRTFVSFFLTILGMVIISVLTFLMYSLFQLLFSNIMTLISEITLRFRLIH